MASSRHLERSSASPSPASCGQVTIVSAVFSLMVCFILFASSVGGSMRCVTVLRVV